jgi:hypothetical protein
MITQKATTVAYYLMSSERTAVSNAEEQSDV